MSILFVQYFQKVWKAKRFIKRCFSNNHIASSSHSKDFVWRKKIVSCLNAKNHVVAFKATLNILKVYGYDFKANERARERHKRKLFLRTFSKQRRREPTCLGLWSFCHSRRLTRCTTMRPETIKGQWVNSEMLVLLKIAKQTVIKRISSISSKRNWYWNKRF